MYATIAPIKVAGTVLSRIVASPLRQVYTWIAWAGLIAVIAPWPVLASDANAHSGTPTTLATERDSISMPPRTQADAIERQPRFIHIVSKDCSLICLATQLGLPITRLLTYNVAVNEAGEMVPAGTELWIPIRFPLHADMAALKVDVMEHRFVAAYGITVPFSRVTEVETWFKEHLVMYGYEILSGQNNGALHFSGGRVVRGTVEFSPGDDAHPTLIDVALVIDENFATPPNE